MPSSSVSSSERSRGGRSAPSGPNSGSVPPAATSAATDSSVSLPVSSLAMLSKRVMSSSTSSSSSNIRRSVRSRSATTSQRRSRTMICEPTAVIDFGPLREVLLVHVVEQRGEVLAVHLPGDREAEEGQQRGRDVVRGRVPVDVVAGLLAVRMADQVGDLVGDPVRGGRGPAHVAVLAEREAVVAEHEQDGVVRHLVEQLAELVVHRLDVVHVGLAHAVDVLVGELELDQPAVGGAEAVVLGPPGADVEGRCGVGVGRVERVHADEERARALDLAQRPDALAHGASRGVA